MSHLIAVVDYHKGNLKSVERGLIAVGGNALITDKVDDIARADAVVLPGVGAFADAAATLDELGLTPLLRERIAQGVPFLGICLGQHLMFEEGTEGADQEDDELSSHNAQGIAVLPGVVDVMPKVSLTGDTYKVPHVGWNTIESCEGDDFDCPLLEGVNPGEYFYFTHSYIAPMGPFVAAQTDYSVSFPSVVQYGPRAFGVQFHPEKSSDAGMVVLRNFVNLVKGA